MTDLIFGYTFEEIQAAQQDAMWGKIIKDVDPNFDILKKGDIDLYKSVGLQGLLDRQFYGVIDRLKRAKLIRT